MYSLRVGGVRRVLCSPITDSFPSPGAWGKAGHFLGVPLKVRAVEMHISTTWKGTRVFRQEWVFEILPVLDHQWIPSDDKNRTQTTWFSAGSLPQWF